MYYKVIPINQFKYTEFQVFIFNTNNSIQHNLFACTQLNASKNFNISLTIQFDSYLFTQLNGQLYV